MCGVCGGSMIPTLHLNCTKSVSVGLESIFHNNNKSGTADIEVSTLLEIFDSQQLRLQPTCLPMHSRSQCQSYCPVAINLRHMKHLMLSLG